VRLAGNLLRASGGLTLGQALAPCHRLLQLDLDYNLLGEKGARMLSQGLQHLRYLESVSLSRNCIGPIGCKVLCEALQRCQGLRSLNLYYNQMKDKGAMEVARLIAAAPLRSLEFLYLGANEISDPGAAEICGALRKHCKQLRVVDLKQNHLKDDGARAIAKILKGIPSLTEAQLHHNVIAQPGEEAIRKALRSAAPSLIPKFNTLSPARKTLAREQAAERRTVNLRFNRVTPLSTTELGQFHDPKEVTYHPKAVFMRESNVGHLPIIG